MLEEVAAVVVPKVVAKVKSLAPPPPDPHALPVFEISPVAEKVAQPGVPPAPETMSAEVDAVPLTLKFVVVPFPSEKFPPVMSPVLEMEKRVEVAVPWLEEAMAKSVIGASEPVVDAACIES